MYLQRSCRKQQQHRNTFLGGFMALDCSSSRPISNLTKLQLSHSINPTPRRGRFHSQLPRSLFWAVFVLPLRLSQLLAEPLSPRCLC